MKAHLEINNDLCDDPRIEKANEASRHAVGLYVRSLSFFAEQGRGAPEVCIHPGIVRMILAGTRPKPVVAALEDVGLWEPIEPSEKGAAAGWLVPESGLWRLRRHRPPLSPAVRAAVIERDGMICQLCLGSVESRRDIHIDHILPVKHGGKDDLDNLQVAHAKCNLSKGARRV